MAIIVTVNGNNTGEGFLLAPAGGTTFPVTVGLHTTDGAHVQAILKVAAGGAGVAFSQTHVSITAVETHVNAHATSASHAHNDTVLQVEVANQVAASFKLTAITEPQIAFTGCVAKMVAVI
jgi:hypothetical protein